MCVCDVTILLRMYDHEEKKAAGCSLTLQECCGVVNKDGRAKLKKEKPQKK